jgi:hypothetical protein
MDRVPSPARDANLEFGKPGPGLGTVARALALAAAAGLIHVELLGVREAKEIVLEFFAIYGVSRPTREEVLKGREGPAGDSD